MPRSAARTLALLTVVVLAAACASSPQNQGAATPRLTRLPPEPNVPLPPGAPGPGEWATWSHEQKLAYMKSGFLDAERVIFASWEPVRFKELTCRNCHGPSVADGSFRMPNPQLAHLAPGAPGFQELAAHEPEVLMFMQQRLVPETARLLGVPAFDFEAHTGFSCYQCHVRQG
ncbi:MAG TPA: hypothetical protein VF765_34015 [Polyangiaceae bacterium]